ncbi:MAG: purine-nucleoside phosphorylase [Chloroflexi bacterium]|nr:purine-nucleoside phosphorylase [Chloroflexota bacterium]
MDEAGELILAQTPYRPRIGLILGTGLGEVAEVINNADIISYDTVPGFPRLTVEGHVGELIIGELEGWVAAAMHGRPHFYEGYSMAEIAFPVRVLRAIGCEVLIVTNAAGGLNPSFQAGDLMLIDDHINLPGMAGFNPLAGPGIEGVGPRFVSMDSAYDPRLIELATGAARNAGITVRNGVYAMVGGPSYETKAELRFLRAIGADAVGMSTAPEVVVARQCSMRVLGISCITNVAIQQDTGAHSQRAQSQHTMEADAGHSGLTHGDVLAQGRTMVPKLAALLRGFLRRLPRQR